MAETHTLYLSTSEEDLEAAAVILRGGGIVAFPTETVYGLGANALNSAAVRKIFQAKGRPGDNPLIVHIANRASLNVLVREVPAGAEALMEKFWPGPLTLIFPKSPRVPAEVTGGLETVAVRMPALETARRLIHLAGVPVAAPSANLSGRPSPTAFRHVREDMDGRADAVIRGEDCAVGVESTVLDLTGARPVLFRPGGVTRKELEAVIGPVELVTEAAPGERPKSPGLKYRHYAPKAEVRILHGNLEQVRAYIARLSAHGQVGMLVFDEFPEMGVVARSLGSRSKPEEAAHRLFTALRELDSCGVDFILAPELPEEDRWLAVRNRLYRAAGGTIVNLNRPRNILLVCTGNTCRSPMAEGLLRAIFEKEDADAQVGSAGLWADGGPVSENAAAAMAELGLDIRNHRSRQITPELAAEADLILTMTEGHRRALTAALPEAAAKTQTLAQWAGAETDVADPFGGDLETYRVCRDQIRGLLEKGWKRGE